MMPTAATSLRLQNRDGGPPCTIRRPLDNARTSTPPISPEVKAARVDVAELAEKSDDELYELIGAEIEGDSLGFGPGDLWHLRRIGQEWFDEHFDDFQRAVCHNKVAGHFTGHKAGDWILDAVAIEGALKATGEQFKTTAVVAVLIARIGLSIFCRNALDSA
jgi:hypothetical protein